MIKAFATERGHPIPYVADWTGESVELLRWDATLGNYAIFTAGARGTGEPVLGKMNPVRQRACMMMERCQVCYEPITRPLLAVLWPGQEIVEGSRRVPLLLEPFACEPCLRVALAVCPGLARIRDKIEVVIVRRHRLVMTVCRPQGPLAKLKNLPAGGVVSYVKAALDEYEPAPGVWLPAIRGMVEAAG